MNEEKLTKLLIETGVILDGHFLLTSGRHSGRFLLCSQLLQYPRHAETVCRLMAGPFKDDQIDTVIGPAMGGVILAYEIARLLGARAIFAERAAEGMVLRRGFKLTPGERILVVEDAVTTGGSVQKVLDLLSGTGVEVVGVSVMIDRTAGRLAFNVPTKALMTMDIESFDQADCPLCRRGLPLAKPKT